MTTEKSNIEIITRIPNKAKILVAVLLLLALILDMKTPPYVWIID